MNYDLWLGPAQEKPIYRNKLQYDWHWDWNTGSGEMGNWGVHVLDDVRNNVFQDKVALPQRIFGGGGRVALRVDDLSFSVRGSRGHGDPARKRRGRRSG